MESLLAVARATPQRATRSQRQALTTQVANSRKMQEVVLT
jgi:hypothetical protein